VFDTIRLGIAGALFCRSRMAFIRLMVAG